MILIDPVVGDLSGTISIDRLVHLVCAVPGELIQSTAGPTIDIVADLSGTMLLEGLYLKNNCSGGIGQCCNIRGTAYSNVGLQILANRCRFYSPYPITSGGVRLRMINCYIYSASEPALFRTANTALEFVACQYNSGSGASDDPSVYSYVGLADVIHTTATADGYGMDYGEWYRGQFEGAAYRFAGRETLEPGHQLDQTQIVIYRETAYQSGQMEPTRWLQTNPDPITGEWSFEYLQTTDANGNPQRYAVQINPPECYQAELLRWYTPEQE